MLVLAAITALTLIQAILFEGYSAGEAPSKFMSVPLDDAFIHFVYARAVFESFGLHYNPGEAQAGFSSLLWVLLLAPGIAVGIWAPLFAKILGLAAHIGLGYVIFDLLRKRTSEAIATAAALLVTADPLMIFAALSGMETTLYALTMAGALWALLSHRPVALAWLSAACVWARPDGVVLVGLIWAALVVEQVAASAPRERRLRAREWTWIVGLPVLAWVLWTAHNLHATGRPFPTSYYVRAGGSVGPGAHAWADITRDLIETFPRYPVLFALAFVPGLAAVLTSAERWRRVPLLLIAPLMAVLMGGTVVEVIGGTFPGNRYLVPIYPALVMLAALGVDWIAARIKDRFFPLPERRRRLDLVAAMLLAFGVWGLPTQGSERATALVDDFAAMCADIREMQVATGQWIRDNTPPGTAVCVFDAGAIRYVSDRPNVDILGLNTAGFPPQDPEEVRRRCQLLATYPVHSAELLTNLVTTEIHRVDRPQNRAGADGLMVVYRIGRVDQDS